MSAEPLTDERLEVVRGRNRNSVDVAALVREIRRLRGKDAPAAEGPHGTRAGKDRADADAADESGEGRAHADA